MNVRRIVQPKHAAILLLLIAAPLVTGCGSLSDFSLKDQEWFARPAKMFNGNASIETPPLSGTKSITPEDMVNADGVCSGMAVASSPADANAFSDGVPKTVASVSPQVAVALGHTECDVVRAISVAPDQVNLSSNERGDRITLLTWNKGQRPGAYTFTSGRLTSIERVSEQAKPANQAKPKKRSAT